MKTHPFLIRCSTLWLVFTLGSCAREPVRPDATAALKPTDASALPLLRRGVPMKGELRKGEMHAFGIPTQPEQFVLGRVEQHDVHLTVTILDPQGRKLREIAWINQPPAAKVFRIHSEAGGEYRIEVRPESVSGMDPFEGKSVGTYEARIEDILNAKQVAERVAESSIASPQLFQLWKQLRDVGPVAEELFWQEIKGKAPLVEAIPGEPTGDVRVSFLWRGDPSTAYVGLQGGPAGLAERPLARLGDSTVWFYTARVPRDSRFTYYFVVADGPPSDPSSSPRPGELRTGFRDPENPNQMGGYSAFELADAPKGPLYHRDADPHGRFSAETLHSEALHEDRQVTVYLAPGVELGKGPYPLLLAFDGDRYGGSTQTRFVPLPALVDRLIAEKVLPPTVVALVANPLGTRGRDLLMSSAFADFVVNEVIPLLQRKYGADRRPERVTLTGSSGGGIASAFIAFRHPDVVGNVLSQSGSFWFSPGLEQTPWPRDVEPGALIREFGAAPKRDIHFYMEAGAFEGSLLESNREMRDVLRAKGYALTYREFNGWHDYICWRESIADGLRALAASRAVASPSSAHHQ
jgi:enterochelin esterase-like enzyme